MIKLLVFLFCCVSVFLWCWGFPVFLPVTSRLPLLSYMYGLNPPFLHVPSLSLLFLPFFTLLPCLYFPFFPSLSFLSFPSLFLPFLPSNSLTVARTIVDQDGLGMLYKGLGPTLVGYFIQVSEAIPAIFSFKRWLISVVLGGNFW